MDNPFAYINDAVTDVLEHPAPVQAKFDGVPIRVVGGFHLADPSLEDEAIKAPMADYNVGVAAFRADRTAALRECSERGIKPLAVIPVATWRHICEATGLFRLHPSQDGVVHFARNAFAGIKDDRRMSGADQIEWLAQNDWTAFLRRLFPNGESVSPSFGYPATLVMSIPPADVAETLLKAKDLDLWVATVAEAVSFKETPSELYRHVRSMEEAVAKMLRDDPIIYFERGCAVAVLAQFGDFPIELQVVNRILSAEQLMHFFPGQVR
jgi:hypothetical protein